MRKEGEFGRKKFRRTTDSQRLKQHGGQDEFKPPEMTSFQKKGEKVQKRETKYENSRARRRFGQPSNP